MSLPFIEIKKDPNELIRIFSDETPQDELCWHRDHDNRVATILDCGEGWSFQFDNELPVPLKKGSRIEIPKEHWHRLHKGQGKLCAKIINLKGEDV